MAKDPLIEDVVPKTLAFRYEPPNPARLYYDYYGDMPEDVKEHFKKIDETYFPYYENGEIHPPKKYEVEKRYTKEDIKKMKLALKAAHRYADINKAFEDGYRLRPLFIQGMGIHMGNVEYTMNGEVNPQKPEFLVYVKNRKTERFQLVGGGYIHRGHTDKKRYELFDTPEAQGHFQLGEYCVRIENNINQPRIDESCDEKRGDYRVGDKWMMHVAVNLYNENGMFADRSPLLDYLSLTGTSYSFYGKRIEK